MALLCCALNIDDLHDSLSRIECYESTGNGLHDNRSKPERKSFSVALGSKLYRVDRSELKSCLVALAPWLWTVDRSQLETFRQRAVILRNSYIRGRLIAEMIFA